jgi:hypothetical protein
VWLAEIQNRTRDISKEVAGKPTITTAIYGISKQTRLRKRKSK